MSSNGKPNPQPPAAAVASAAAGNGSGGPPKMYQRPIYRPQAPAKRRRGGGRGRSCRFSCCCCFFYAVLVVLLLAFLAAVAGGAFYLLYRPHRPAFTLSLARVNKLSLSSSATAPTLTDSIDVTLTAKNPNKKLVYLYDDFTVTAATAANAVPLGEGSVPGFVHEAGNITVIKTTVSASTLGVDPTTASSDIKKSGDFPITLDLETKAGVKVGGLKTKKIGVQVHCEGIKVAARPRRPRRRRRRRASSSPSRTPRPPPPSTTRSPPPRRRWRPPSRACARSGSESRSGSGPSSESPTILGAALQNFRVKEKLLYSFFLIFSRWSVEKIQTKINRRLL